MGFSVTRTRTGLFLALCVKCGFSGRYKREDEAWQQELTHLCTYPEDAA